MNNIPEAVFFLLIVFVGTFLFFGSKQEHETAAYRATLTPCQMAEYDYQNSPFVGQAQVALLREIQLGCATLSK